MLAPDTIPTLPGLGLAIILWAGVILGRRR